MIKHVVFDFDGTIADTSPLIPSIIHELLEQFEKPKLSDDEIVKLMELPWKNAAKAYGIKMREVPKFALAAQKIMHTKLNEVDLHDNMKEVLTDLSDNYTTNIVSLNSKENIKKVIKNHNIHTIGKVYSTKGKTSKRKILKKYMKKFDISNHEILYVGDELGDIKACKKNNIKVIAVTWGYDSKEILKSGNPDYIVDSALDIAAIAAGY